MSGEFFAAVQSDNAEDLAVALAKDPGLLSAPGPGGWPGIHLAAYFGALSSLRTLIAAGANIELRSRNDDNNTPLHAAVAGGQPDSVKVLVAAGADIHATYARGTHVLHEAAFLGRADLVALLIELGANRTAKNDGGKTPADVAQQRGHAHIVDVLEHS